MDQFPICDLFAIILWKGLPLTEILIYLTTILAGAEFGTILDWHQKLGHNWNQRKKCVMTLPSISLGSTNTQPMRRNIGTKMTTTGMKLCRINAFSSIRCIWIVFELIMDEGVALLVYKSNYDVFRKLLDDSQLSSNALARKCLQKMWSY